MGKNTAPAIASTFEFVRQKGSEDDIVIIVPSDHLIKDTQAFAKTVSEGAKLANEGYIVIFWIRS